WSSDVCSSDLVTSSLRRAFVTGVIDRLRRGGRVAITYRRLDLVVLGAPDAHGQGSLTTALAGREGRVHQDSVRGVVLEAHVLGTPGNGGFLPDRVAVEVDRVWPMFDVLKPGLERGVKRRRRHLGHSASHGIFEPPAGDDCPAGVAVGLGPLTDDAVETELFSGQQQHVVNA